MGLNTNLSSVLVGQILRQAFCGLELDRTSQNMGFLVRDGAGGILERARFGFCPLSPDLSVSY